MESLGFPSLSRRRTRPRRPGRTPDGARPPGQGRPSSPCSTSCRRTHKIFSTIDKDVATGYYHWFFLIQGNDLPETLIGHDPAYYLRAKLRQWAGDLHAFDPRALNEYTRCFSNPACIHASCEDYRAAASIDLEHDEADMDRNWSARCWCCGERGA